MALAELLDDLIVVRTDWAEKDMIKEVPGCRWDPDDKVWTLPPSWASQITLRHVFGNQVQLGPLLTQWIWDEYHSRIEPVRGVRELYRDYPRNLSNGDDHETRLYDFQLWGRDYLVIAGDAGLFDDMGTGKTVQALAAIRKLGLDVALPALVICPNSVKHHWAAKTKEWLPETTAYPLVGTALKRRQRLERAADDPRAIVVVNIESVRSFSRLEGFGSIRLAKCIKCDPRNTSPVGEEDGPVTEARCETHQREFNGFGFKTVIIDEAHRIGDPKSKHTRAVWAVAHDPSVQRRWPLTGSWGDDMGKMWSIMHAVSPLDFPRKSAFVDRYAFTRLNPFGGLEIGGVRQDRKDELFAFLNPRFRRMTKDLVLPQLPEKVRTTVPVEMTAKQAKAYHDLEEHLKTRLEDGTLWIEKTNLIAGARLLQLASSYCDVKIEPGDLDRPAKWVVTLKEPSPKLDALVDLIDDMGGKPVAVAAEQRQLIELAAPRLEKHGLRVVQITGAVPGAIRPLNLDRFQRGQADVMLFTYKTGGVGLDMTRSDTLIRLQRSWAMTDNLQGEDRVHRIGSERHRSINIIDLVTLDTAEEEQMTRLAGKVQRMVEITQDRERRRAAGLDTSDLDVEWGQLMNADLGGPR